MKTSTASRTSRREKPAPRYTRETATEFEAVSSKSAQQVIELLEDRKTAGTYPECPCEPYEGVYTFERWKALGFFVRKGEKSLRVASYVAVDSKKKEGDSAPVSSDDSGSDKWLKPHTLYLFCRCQVDPIEVKPEGVTVG
jgi:hypothetical protein